jgi:hypothetical protein
VQIPCRDSIQTTTAPWISLRPRKRPRPCSTGSTSTTKGHSIDARWDAVAEEFAAADVDKDKTLTKDEYLTIVEQRFKAADTDNDGTLTGKELTKAGRALLRLLK